MFFVHQAASFVSALLDESDVRGRIAVIGQPRLAAAVDGEGRELLQFAARARGLRRSRGHGACAAAESLPLADGSVDAAIGIADGAPAEAQAIIAEWSRVARPGGQVVLVGRGEPSGWSRLALCAGLTDLRQRVHGRLAVTAGVVLALPSSQAA